MAAAFPSWSHPSGICDIPFALHHFLLQAALHSVFGESFSVLEPKNVFMRVLTGNEGSHGKKEKNSLFLPSVLIQIFVHEVSFMISVGRVFPPFWAP